MTLERVRVRDCACPGEPHSEEGDIVFLAPKLPALGGIVAEQQMVGVTNQDDLVQKWLVTFVRYGAQGWNLVDEDGDVPFDVEALLADWELARPVALEAAERYQKAVAAPFETRPAKRSPTGRTPATTSRRRSQTPTPSE